MSKDPLNEREFELINIVGAELAQNQRGLSEQMNLSLGTINMLIKRLMSKGYIRIRQLNERKVKYILTPKGFAEKMQKSVKYTMKTINSLGLIREKVNAVIKRCYENGHRSFYVLGTSDLATLIDIAFHDANIKDYTLTYVEESKLIGDGVLLVCRENIKTNDYKYDEVIDLIAELAKDPKLVN